MSLHSSRRQFIQRTAIAAGAAWFSQVAQGQSAVLGKPIKIALPSPGTAGSVWKPMLARVQAQGLPVPALDWTLSDPGRMQVQLVAGTLDVGFFGPVGLAALRARGNDIVLFGPGTNNHSVWLVKGDSPFQHPQELKGRRIATQPETAETYQQARIAASLAGLDLKQDFDVVHGAPLANVALFERGDVDAVIVLEPTASRLVAHGARQIGRVGSMWSGADDASADPYLIGLAAQRRWVEDNRQAASALARAFAQANAELAQQPQLLAQLHDAIGVRASETQALALVPQRMRHVYGSQWNETVWRGIDQQVETAVSLGLIERAPGLPVYDGVALA